MQIELSLKTIYFGATKTLLKRYDLMSDIAIRVREISKSYRIHHQIGNRATNLGEAVMQKLRKPFNRSADEVFWALKDINAEINSGEVIGVVGRNGAGKSTLLKILSRVTEPTEGRIELFGRVGSLLEVGTGFHPELTGRENIFLNGAILGMRRSEIVRHFDAIVDFSGVEKFIDTPVKRYSSGMYVRLAFAVAAHLNPEILVIDEVLAVGDAEFQKKCLGKMDDVAKSGRTVLFVSHNIGAVQSLCHKGILLSHGRVEYVGPIQECLSQYVSARKQTGKIIDHTTRRHPAIQVEHLLVNSSESDRLHLPVGERDLAIEIRGRILEDTQGDIQVRLFDTTGIPIGIFSPAFENGTAKRLVPGSFSLERVLRLPRLNTGEYSLMFEVVIPNVAATYEARDALRIDVDGTAMITGQTFRVSEQLGYLLLEEAPEGIR